jgi:hypothetical protein
LPKVAAADAHLTKRLEGVVLDVWILLIVTVSREDGRPSLASVAFDKRTKVESVWACYACGDVIPIFSLKVYLPHGTRGVLTTSN